MYRTTRQPSLLPIGQCQLVRLSFRQSQSPVCPRMGALTTSLLERTCSPVRPMKSALDHIQRWPLHHWERSRFHIRSEGEFDGNHPNTLEPTTSCCRPPQWESCCWFPPRFSSTSHPEGSPDSMVPKTTGCCPQSCARRYLLQSSYRALRRCRLNPGRLPGITPYPCTCCSDPRGRQSRSLSD